MPLGEIAKDVYNSLPPGMVPFIAQTLVSAFISAFFSYKSDKKIVLETAKTTYLCDQVEELHKEGLVSETEFLKCKNLTQIAKLADKARDEQRSRTKNNKTNAGTANYDFDWFWRFFERAGYASDEDMQKLWASVLNAEIDYGGQFSYKAIETLFVMGPHVANVFMEYSVVSFTTPYGECLVPASGELYENFDIRSPVVVEGESDIFSALAAAYSITNERTMYLDEYGLISSMLTVSTFRISHDSFYISNDCYVIELKLKDNLQLEELTIEITGHRFTSVARQLFCVIDEKPSLGFLIDFAILLQKRYSELEVHVYEVVGIDQDGSLSIEDGVDYLTVPDCIEKSKISELRDVDLR